MDEASLICARLLRQGTVPRAEVTALDYADVRSEVERRLHAVGLVLATSAYSEYVGIRLSPEVTADPAFDAASNLGLHADACALLVILWTRLVLQKRTATDTREVPGQAALFGEERAAQAREFDPHVRFEALYREFGPTLGSRTHLKGLVSRLRRLGFASGEGDVIRAGPLLELGINGERMMTFIRRDVLAEWLRQKPDQTGDEVVDTASQLVSLIKRLDAASISDIERETGERRHRLHPLLKELIKSGRIRTSGQRQQTRYHTAES